MLCYVDDFLRISSNPKEDTDASYQIYQLKEGFEQPDQYLGTNAEKAQLEDGHVFCSTNFVDDLNSAIENVNNALWVDNTALKHYGDVPSSYSSSFRP